ncbi:undecaprenyldiphospho-muramoylpentapeptide beta-N-acetylglucosaminyltransferase [Orrella daihaiensis]|uniref:UDP-N-acetylglucosamine--N-acetylmuramyl-(pentapeptide) pyrophosphoryl-undecaprenol N-acetylglucosamine transferase n=1 Tax=Orrella daihaiensis TaxID=2782176 RepID=A0ABY4AKM6_9BURK|nr:undecaprenyldiphospho-muramoylpentapeptide beta-N-acetylglucosaminyltransferase [Orrella daihaiensis]UOD50841.1 undecaprenyldiphospho-muramoylpentapeptide beta-N-acetylglucosaminyltransferase [Orrella daihaiensis]
MRSSALVWIMAGGTGGHIMPGLAVAQWLRDHGCDIKWIGNPGKMEGRLVPPAGYEMIPVTFAGVRGKGLLAKLRAPFGLLASMANLWRAMSKDKPALVLGMGGYVAMPGGLVARLRGVPIVLHEQNAIAGKTNLWLARIAKLRLEGFPMALPEGRWVGNPVRGSLAQLPDPVQRYSNRTGPIKVLVVGGSLGAAALNEAIPLAISRIDPSSRPQITHQSGEQHLEALQQAYRDVEVDASCVAFIDDMAGALGEADLVICRAGAMTVSEVAAVGVAALFVPFPFAVDDHQTANAGYLVSHGAAYLRQQRDLAVEWLARWLEAQTRETLLAVAVKARQQAKPEATAAIGMACLSLMEGRA